MRRSLLLLTLLLAGAPSAPAAHAETCSEVWVTGDRVANQDERKCVDAMDPFACQHEGAGVAPDIGVEVEVCV